MRFSRGGLPIDGQSLWHPDATVRFEHRDGLVTAIVGPDGSTTRFERQTEAGTSRVTVVAPYGERTNLYDDNGDGLADRVEYEDDPAGRGYELRYDDGLLVEMRDRWDIVHQYGYDDLGRLETDGLAGRPPQLLAPSSDEHALGSEGAFFPRTTVRTLPGGQNVEYRVDRLEDGAERRRWTYPDGTVATLDASRSQAELIGRDGTTLHESFSPDEVLGGSRTRPSAIVLTTPDGRSTQARVDVEGALSDEGIVSEWQVDLVVDPGDVRSAPVAHLTSPPIFLVCY